jgi:hypothetical protein
VKRRLLIDSLVLDFVGKLKRRDRDFLVARFEAIREFPSRYVDYRTIDESGRELDGHIAGRFAIVFWDDSADRHLKIMDVTWADEMT